MKRALRCLPFLFVLALPILEAQPKGWLTRERILSGGFAGDSLAVRSLDPTLDFFPDASLIDFSALLEPPAGKHGFVGTGKKGRLEFNDESPARFWGVVIGGRNINTPNYLVEKIVGALARAGVNLIRFVARPEDQEKRGEAMSVDFLERLDYWIAAAKRKGIYSSVSLHGPSPTAIFAKNLLESQKSTIQSVAVSRKNPYTGMAYADDPAIAFFEIGDGRSLLSEPSLWTTMPEPDWKEFNLLWNTWLQKQYRSTARLRAAWTNASGIAALTMSESLEKKNIRLPGMDDTPFDQAILAPYHDPLRSPARRSDAVRFAMALQRSYFEEMHEALTRLGIRVPILAAARNDLLPVTAVASRMLNMTAGESYYDYPTKSSRRELAGMELFSMRNPVTERGSWSFAPNIARTHWSGSPVAVRAWTTCWPNPFRSAGVLEVAAYSSFQGVDVVVHDNYQTIGDLMSIGSFEMQADPARWGLFGLAAKMFLSGEVREGETTIAVAYSEEDLATHASYENALYELAWNYRMVNRFSNTKVDEAVFTVTSGRSHLAGIEEENTVLYARSPLVETKKQQVSNERNSLYARSGYPLKVYVLRNDSVMITLDSLTTMYVKPRFAFRIKDVEIKGLVPLGADRSGIYTAGFLDTAKNVLGLGGIVDTQIGAIILDHVHRKPASHESEMRTVSSFFRKRIGEGIYESETRELLRNTADGVFMIKAPRVAAVQGSFRSGVRYEAGTLAVTSVSPIGTVAVSSLDGKPLAEASQVLVKMVTIAENSGQKLDTVNVPGVGKKFALRSPGGFPVRTMGASSDQPTSIWLNGRKMLDVYMRNGTWEMFLDLRKKEYLLHCDTPEVRFHLFPEETGGTVTMEKHFYSRVPLKERGISKDFRYPGSSKYVRLMGEEVEK